MIQYQYYRVRVKSGDLIRNLNGRELLIMRSEKLGKGESLRRKVYLWIRSMLELTRKKKKG